MANLLRTAALELQCTNNNQVVKVAGIMRRLKNWVRQLADKEYASSVEKLQGESVELKGTLRNLNRHIDKLLGAIRDGDMESYDINLSLIRDLSVSLSRNLSELNQDAEGAKEELPQQEDTYGHNEWKDPEYKKKLLEKIRNDKLKGVPFGAEVKGKNYPFYAKEFNDHLYEKDVAITPSAESVLIDKVSEFLIAQKFPAEEVLAAKNDVAWKKDFVHRMNQAIRNGTVLKYEPEAVDDPSKEKGIRQRFVGDMLLVIKTVSIDLPKFGIEVEMVVLVHDMTARPGAAPVLTFGSVRSIKATPRIMPTFVGAARLDLMRKLAGIDRGAVKQLPDSF